MSASEIKVLCWNLHHGRDAPPDPALRTRRTLLPRTLDNGRYLQVNRDLEREFAALIAGAEWSICLLQEAPPRWAAALAKRTGAEAYRVLTSRNQLGFLTGLLARWNPDLVGAWEGGSNLTLVRRPWRLIRAESRSLLLNPLPGRPIRRERRRVGFVALEHTRPEDGRAELCVANLHASHYDQAHAEADCERAAEAATDWARGRPLLVGGDFNVRPQRSTLFERLERRFGLAAPTAPDAIDHLLVRGLEVVSPPRQWPDEARDLTVEWRSETRRIRLSDHAPVEAMFAMLY